MQVEIGFIQSADLNTYTPFTVTPDSLSVSRRQDLHGIPPIRRAELLLPLQARIIPAFLALNHDSGYAKKGLLLVNSSAGVAPLLTLKRKLRYTVNSA